MKLPEAESQGAERVFFFFLKALEELDTESGFDRGSEGKLRLKN